MFPAGIYYAQTRGLPCLYEQTYVTVSDYFWEAVK